MQTVLYDGSFDGWLCAVYDVYEYKFNSVDICTKKNFTGNIFQTIHHVDVNEAHSTRVWNGLEKKLSSKALKQLYQCFFSEIKGIENEMLEFVKYAFNSPTPIENDFTHQAVLTVSHTAKKVHRESHRMEAFIRFTKTKDDLYCAIIEPDFNVVQLISDHFLLRYADQRWLIYDSRRKYGIYYDLKSVENVTIQFSSDMTNKANISEIYDENESLYQLLWQQYFKSVNIDARKNTKLHIQHLPKRYWKFLTEKVG